MGCNNNVNRILRNISPGTVVVLQYNDQPLTTAIFQGFQNGAALFTGIPGTGTRVSRIAVGSINLIAL